MIDYRYKATERVVTIYDSYKISKFHFNEVLDEIEKENPQCKVFKERSRFSLCMEWTVHNFLYNINIERQRTKDVDLDTPSDKPEWLYCICGLLTWLFIR